jgi:C1A family cysteine protease
MKLVIIALLAVFILCDTRTEFENYKKKFNKNYSPNEEKYRYNVFVENLNKIEQINNRGETWTAGVNQFTDLTHEEFASQFRPLPMPERKIEYTQPVNDVGSLPKQWDWRTQGAVVPIKDQGQCGSCWAFSATGTVEAAWFIMGNQLTSLSEQQIVDCDEQCYGCDGGWMYLALEYVAQYGQESEADYPYVAYDQQCQYDKSLVVAHISGYQAVTPYSASALQAAVYKQTVSIGVEADQDAWQYYTGGVLSSGCGASIDHGVIVVGYNMAASPPYWIVRNSWGTSWGLQGYIQLGTGDGGNGSDGVCGIYTMPYVPDL